MNQKNPTKSTRECTIEDGVAPLAKHVEMVELVHAGQVIRTVHDEGAPGDLPPSSPVFSLIARRVQLELVDLLLEAAPPAVAPRVVVAHVV